MHKFCAYLQKSTKLVVTLYQWILEKYLRKIPSVIKYAYSGNPHIFAYILSPIIDNLKKDYTILIIAHRLSTIVNADRILLLNNGKIECEGSHEELLQNSEEYRHLYEAEITE